MYVSVCGCGCGCEGMYGIEGVCVCIYVCMYVCVYVCMCVYVYPQSQVSPGTHSIACTYMYADLYLHTYTCEGRSCVHSNNKVRQDIEETHTPVHLNYTC